MEKILDELKKIFTCLKQKQKKLTLDIWAVADLSTLWVCGKLILVQIPPVCSAKTSRPNCDLASVVNTVLLSVLSAAAQPGVSCATASICTAPSYCAAVFFYFQFLRLKNVFWH